MSSSSSENRSTNKSHNSDVGSIRSSSSVGGTVQCPICSRMFPKADIERSVLGVLWCTHATTPTLTLVRFCRHADRCLAGLGPGVGGEATPPTVRRCRPRTRRVVSSSEGDSDIISDNDNSDGGGRPAPPLSPNKRKHEGGCPAPTMLARRGGPLLYGDGGGTSDEGEGGGDGGLLGPSRIATAMAAVHASRADQPAFPRRLS